MLVTSRREILGLLLVLVISLFILAGCDIDRHTTFQPSGALPRLEWPSDWYARRTHAALARQGTSRCSDHVPIPSRDTGSSYTRHSYHQHSYSGLGRKTDATGTHHHSGHIASRHNGVGTVPRRATISPARRHPHRPTQHRD